MEIGILRAAGWQQKRVYGLFIREAILVGLASVGTAAIATYALQLALRFALADGAAFAFDWKRSLPWFVVSGGVVVVAVMAGAAFPARKAAKSDPIKVIKGI